MNQLKLLLDQDNARLRAVVRDLGLVADGALADLATVPAAWAARLLQKALRQISKDAHRALERRDLAA